jgi:hypothetical protein
MTEIGLESALALLLGLAVLLVTVWRMFHS